MFQQQGKGNGLKSVTSTYQVESTVVSLPVDKVWEYLKSFQFEKVFPTVVKSIRFTSGGPTEVGSVFQIEFKDGTTFEKRIVEISEVKRRLVWEVISATPESSFSSMLSTVKIYKVTEDNTTFLVWETNYSNDVDTSVLLSEKNRKYENFKDLKKLK
jgi:hypothetical protein